MHRLIAFALFTAVPVWAQESDPSPEPARERPRPVARAALLAGDIRIDGRLDDAAWASATAYQEFTQLDPDEGQPGSEKTELRVMYDDAALYLGLRMYDSDPAGIRARLGRRDEPIFGADLVEVYLDTYLDRLTGFVFRITPAGAIRDAAWLAPGSGGFGQDNSWDAVWESRATIDSAGWTAELRIPFSQLRYSNGPADTTWGIQVRRDIARKGETALFAFTPKRLPGGAQAWGNLTGLRGLPRNRNLELMPYITARAEYLDVAQGNPFRGGSEYRAKVGGDLRYSLTSSMRLTATVNPDFGQVEVDPARVNLSANELFFPERRPFFIEGADIFYYGRVRSFNSFAFPTFFHSRRIGRAPQRSVSGQRFVDSPEEATIAGAAKITGKTSRGLSLGVLDAVTLRETARIANSTDQRSNEPVEPTTNYFVGRARQDYNQGNTTIGALLTAVNRDLADAPLAALLRRDAYFGGLDFNQSWKQREWTLDGSVSRSAVYGAPSALALTQRSSVHYFQRPDLESVRFDPNRRSLLGSAWQISAAKNSGKHWVGSATYQSVSPGFEINDVGFHSLTAYRAASGVVVYKEDRPGKVFRNFLVGNFSGYNTNSDGDKIGHYYGFAAEGRLTNFWFIKSRAIASAQQYDDRLTRGGPIMVQPAARSVNMQVRTDDRRTYLFNVEYEYYGDRANSRKDGYSLEFAGRPSSALRISFSPQFESAKLATQYVSQAADESAVDTYGRRYLFGRLRYNELSLVTRVDWTFTPTLSLQLFAQPLVATGAYSDFRSLRRPRTQEFDRFSEADGSLTSADGSYTARPASGSTISFQDPDFHARSLLGNAVVRWEFRPGSALFLVWQQRRSGDGPLGDFDVGRDVSGLFRTSPENVFAIKATYWIGR